MNETIELLLNHRSIRKFKDQPLNDEQISQLVEAAQMASTSSFVQAYTIIGVKDPEKKKKLAEIAGNQQYVAENGHFFVFCADFHRHQAAGELEGIDVSEAIESTEKLVVGITDASLAAQNCAVAAESMGLGICYIGGLRNDIQATADLLNLPEHVFPVFGMCVGYPDAEPSIKPRLPKAGVYFEDSYPSEEKHFVELENYNDTTAAYYESRTEGKRKDRWTAQVSGMLSSIKRAHMKDFLHRKGFGRK
ncbi:oxygen-insensitive NADPH nitroreductase [Alkalicoccus saliphilus]|jgi:FMN reductase (NADPH)|uniref:Oxygen-insensitive NADPH nitroreductase n=1 Tax=Alkalicoccus saliphilus TaxID=200989 RepID=A0A2T4UA51_9BACI|nr:oxygen-insensitive NADPH nitroreductase [Alkalicoccus saliphilus]PTL40249.1 oxygen-insensitive NADPH nitroreductase [Alkalicoccus saliphilus]